jgi:hypothetical protein
MFYVQEVRDLLLASNFRTPALSAGFENFSVGGSVRLIRDVSPSSLADLVKRRLDFLVAPKRR